MPAFLRGEAAELLGYTHNDVIARSANARRGNLGNSRSHFSESAAARGLHHDAVAFLQHPVIRRIDRLAVERERAALARLAAEDALAAPSESAS